MSLTAYLIVALLFLIYLKINNEIHISILDSLLLPNTDSIWTKVVFALVWPFTLIYLFTIKIKNMKKFVILAVVVFFIYSVLYTVGTSFINYYNQSVQIEMSFNKDLSKRGVTVDKMKKQIHEQLKVAGINDTSYSRLVEIIANSRKDGQGLFWKWAQENNANANYSEVSALYNKLFDNIESTRTDLYATETLLQKDVYDWDYLHKVFPANWYLFYQKGKKLDYKPILSTESAIINSTGVDNTSNL